MPKNQLAALVASTITSAAFSLALMQPSNQNQKKPIIIIPIIICADDKKIKASALKTLSPTFDA